MTKRSSRTGLFLSHFGLRLLASILFASTFETLCPAQSLTYFPVTVPARPARDCRNLSPLLPPALCGYGAEGAANTEPDQPSPATGDSPSEGAPVKKEPPPGVPGLFPSLKPEGNEYPPDKAATFDPQTLPVKSFNLDSAVKQSFYFMSFLHFARIVGQEKTR